MNLIISKYMMFNMPPMLFDTNALHVMPHLDGKVQDMNKKNKYRNFTRKEVQGNT
jgi:hypothetical protein